MRRPDWRERLAAFIADAGGRRFELGKWDCAIFAAGAVEAVRGVDYARPFRGRYRTARGGLRVLRIAGIRDPLDACRLHFDETPPAFAGMGDLAAIETGQGRDVALGVVAGGECLFVGADGLRRAPLLQAVTAFRV